MTEHGIQRAATRPSYYKMLTLKIRWALRSPGGNIAPSMSLFIADY